MPSTYTSNLGIELPADGELDGVWGDVVNDNMSIIDRATNGSVTLTLSGTSSTLTTSDGTLSDGQYKLLVLGGSPSGTHTITIAPSDAQKIYFVRNTTAQSVVFTQGSGGNVTVATGDSAIIYSDGAGAGAAVVNVSNDFSMSSVKITGGTIDGTTIGGTTPAAGSFTTLSASGDVTIADKIVHDGDTNTSIRFPAADTVTVETSGAERMRIDSSGNVLVGLTTAVTGSTAGSVSIRSNGINMFVGGGTVARESQAGLVLSGSDIVPYFNGASSDNGVDLGASALRFRDLNLAGALRSDVFTVTNIAGTERMRIDSSGNVGIGTTSPDTIFEVVGADPILTIRDVDTSTTTANATIRFAESGAGDTLNEYWDVGLSPISALAFSRMGTERMRIDSSGNVGIGTSSPAAKLDVSGGVIADNVSVENASSVSGSGMWGTTTTLAFNTGSTERMRITSTGNVGIGTSSPANILTVAKSSADVYSGTTLSPSGVGNSIFIDNVNDTVGSFGQIVFRNGATGQIFNRIVSVRDASSQGSLAFVTGSSAAAAERMRIDSSGNVGIGTAAPAARLDVTGASINALQARFGNLANRGLEISTALVSSRNDAGSVLNARADGQAGTLIFQREGTESMRIDASGNVGIGTSSPAQRLDVRSAAANAVQARFGFTSGRGLEISTALVSGTNDAGSVLNALGATAGTMIFQTDSTERMRIDSSGNVGIGTSSPIYTLDVRGQAGIELYDLTTSGKVLNFRPSLGDANKYNMSISAFDHSGGGVGPADGLSINGFDGVSIATGSSTARQERMRIDSSGNVGIGTSVPSDYNASADNLVVGTTSGNNGITIAAGTASQGSLFFADGTANATEEAAGYLLYVHSDDSMRVGTANTERMRINSSGNVGIGTTTPAGLLEVFDVLTVPARNTLTIANKRGLSIYNNQSAGAVDTTLAYGNTVNSYLAFGHHNGTSYAERMRIDAVGNVGIGTATITPLGSNITTVTVNGTSGGGIQFQRTDATAVTGLVAALSGAFALGSITSTPVTFRTNNTEAMRIDASGNLLVGKTTTAFGTAGVRLNPNGEIIGTVNGGPILYVNRLTSDGNLVEFSQDTVTEGSISVSGTTVSYNGGHLSRWAQFPDNSRPEILKGTVMSNLDQMSQWGDEDNEQLNCVQVSTVEGDPDVAGVFVAWDSTDDGYNDILLAMTGDMVIRIGAGVTVARGDLLMSAGDGTAKPQGDDIVRSKTIAKVTSTHVSHTYADGSYAVPCVLMAC